MQRIPRETCSKMFSRRLVSYHLKKKMIKLNKYKCSKRTGVESEFLSTGRFDAVWGCSLGADIGFFFFLNWDIYIYIIVGLKEPLISRTYMWP